MRGPTVLVLCAATALAAGCASGPDVHPSVVAIDPPAAPGSSGPSLHAGADGRLYLSWVEPDGDAHALRFSVRTGDGWSDPRTIASGKSWFVNQADFPSMAALADGTLAAHWLEKSADSAYAYDVRLSLSSDGGNRWSDPLTPHTDGTPTEHGFVSIVPGERGFDVVWLDGREMALAAGGHGAAGAGVMTLRSARIDRELAVKAEALVDDCVCDCCQTDAVRLEDGALLAVFRDRTELDVRDISAARFDGDRWTAPVPVHRDGWVMPACPVNGPAVAASGDAVAVAWFTGASGEGRVHVAFSADGGRSFGEPVPVSEAGSLGRVDVALVDADTAAVSWLERGRIRLRRFGRSGPLGDPLTVARTDESRASGFPRMARLGGDLFLAWTEAGDPSRVRAARVPPDRLPG
jgi:hypothetical protein